MNRVEKFLAAAIILSCMFALFESKSFAQRSRTVSNPETNGPSTEDVPPPASVEAKYEGGFIGYPKKAEGTLSFDDVNRRLVFRDKTNHEVVSMPFDAILAAYGDTQSRRPRGATIAESVPVPYGLNFPAHFIKKKYRYLTLQFRDPDTQASGILSYQIKHKEELASVLVALGKKADLTQRGDAFVRKTPQTTSQQNTSTSTTPPKDR
jgi:hypothetical protein